MEKKIEAFGRLVEAMLDWHNIMNPNDQLTMDDVIAYMHSRIEKKLYEES